MSRNMRRVIATQIKTGEETVCESIAEAAQLIGVTSPTIMRYCENGTASCGYTFRFVEERESVLTDLQAKIIMMMADNGLRPYRAAQILGYSNNGIMYQVNQIQRITGKDPRDFWDMIELVKMAKGILEEEKQYADHD